MQWSDFKQHGRGSRYGMVGLLDGRAVCVKRLPGAMTYEFRYISDEELDSYCEWEDSLEMWHTLTKKYNTSYIGYFRTGEFRKIE